MTNRRRRSDGQDVLKGLAAGLIGGLVASWTMNQFQALWSKLSEENDAQQKKDSNAPRKGNQPKQSSQQSEEKQEPTTVKTAEAISENVFGHELTKREKKIAGPTVHYAFGSTMGALYGATSELLPETTMGAGLAFGAAVWLGADEAALPLLGLSKSPTAYPLSKHASALASHFVYGLTTDLVRRAVRRAL